jgi:hypothetical protein
MRHSVWLRLLHGERVALTAFVTYTVPAGGAVGIRFSNRELAIVGVPVCDWRWPLACSWLSWSCSAAFLRGRTAGLAVYGLFTVGAAFGLIYYALVRACRTRPNPVGVCATGHSLARGALAAGAPHRRGGHRNPALAGVAVILASVAAERAPAVGAYRGWRCDLPQQAQVLVRRFPRVHPVTMNAVGMTAGAAAPLAASLVADEPIVLPHRPDMAAMTYLVVIGSVVVFLLLPGTGRRRGRPMGSSSTCPSPWCLSLADNEPVGLTGAWEGSSPGRRLRRSATKPPDSAERPECEGLTRGSEPASEPQIMNGARTGCSTSGMVRRYAPRAARSCPGRRR